MPDKGKINARQAGFLMFTFMMGSASVLVPATAASFAKQDGWLVIIVASVLGLGIVLLYTALGIRFPRQSIVQYSETILGKWAGKAVGLLYIGYSLYLGSLVTGNFRDYVITTALPSTPKAVVSGIFLAVIAYGVRGGIETLGRVNEIIIIPRELVVVVLIILVFKEFHWKNITPFLGDGVAPVLKGSFVVTSLPFGETILFSMLIPSIRNIRKVKMTYIVTILAGGFFLLVSVLASLLLFGPSISARLIFPAQMAIQFIDIADVFTNLDALGMLIWVLSGFIKIAVCYYCAAVGIAQFFKLSDYRALVTPVGILMFLFSFTMYGSFTDDAEFVNTTWPFFSIPFVVLFPLLMLTVAKIRRLDGRGGAA